MDPLLAELLKAKERMNPSKSYPGVDYVPCNLFPNATWQLIQRGIEYKDKDDSPVWFLELQGTLWAVVKDFLNYYHDSDAWQTAARGLALRSKGVDVI